MTAAIERLADLGVLDDAAFARTWLESRDRARPRGERALQMELRQKGIDADTVAQALVDRRAAGVLSATDDEPGPSADERAAGLLARHARASTGSPIPASDGSGPMPLLARSGFDPGVCHDAAAAWVASATDADPDAGT